MRSARASSPDVSRRSPDRFSPPSSAATMRPGDVVSGSFSATLGVFWTCRGGVAQPARSSARTASSGIEPPRPDSAPHVGLRIAASYQAHFASMQTQRHIRSFVLRAGRMTPAQERALKDLWPSYGVDLTDDPFHFAPTFPRRPPPRLHLSL